ncbi:YdcF family protein [Paraburkholderia pallida]|uniref:YdcF family protein n=1 Tax=Paraburkholderia pallida TaxID=2547399 RepID=A0A4P7CTH8_9BURK|nr:YdcF family protein [Paraburkholderia pallida]QBQ97329.1 YdcF family protein [Paraburkholderia pallida]
MLWHGARRPIAIAAVVLFWLLGSGWFAKPLVDLAQPENYRTPYDPATMPASAFGPRTAIVMLGGGTDTRADGTLVPKHDVYARIALAAALQAKCLAAGGTCTVIVSGGNPQHHAASEADTYAPWLLRAGVARHDLVLENRSLTTWENARNVAPIVHAQRADTLFVVTSAYHMPRAMLDFHRFRMNPVPAVSDVRSVSMGIWPRLANLRNAETALHELIGIAQFYVYRMLGWF